jgi:hypothetical protein
MKKILLLFLLFASTLLTVRTYGQLPVTCNGGTSSCNLIPQDVRIEVVGDPICSDAGYTTLTFNVSFKIDANSGNKQIYIHTWLDTQFPSVIGNTKFPCDKKGTEDPYLVDTLGGLADWGMSGFSFLDIGLDNTASSMSIRASNAYAPDPLVLLTSNSGPAGTVKAPNMTVTKTHLADGLDLIELTNVVAKIPVPCGTAIHYKTLVWATQANEGKKASCWAVNRGVQVLNDPDLTLTADCRLPRHYGFSITTSNTTLTQFHYVVTLQDPLSANFVQLTDGDVSLIASVGGGLFQSGDLIMQNPYGNTNPYRNWDIRLDVTSPSYSNTITTGDLALGCGTLPIKLRSFDANRNKSNVDLKWVTEIEINNRGFYVERMLSNGGWQEITFVASQAANGNSSSPLTYVLTDLNNAKGISQYRLRQVDFDGKQAYSQIRSVRGEGQKSNTIIYPNPSADGKVNIVFEGTNSIRDVSLMDVGGKTLKQWKGVTNNNIHIDNLNAGFYTVRIVNVETGEQVVEKIIVNKR